MARLVPVAELGAIRPGATLSVAIADGDVVLFNVDGVVYALHDACARCGAPLSQGTYSGMHVLCTGCGWEYDVRTGAVSAVPDLRIHTFDVTVVGSQLMVIVAGRDADAH
jgi:nitrite reductase/ring-hydroxylating ferredoxin subunit